MDWNIKQHFEKWKGEWEGNKTEDGGASDNCIENLDSTFIQQVPENLIWKYLYKREFHVKNSSFGMNFWHSCQELRKFWHECVCSLERLVGKYII